jgi:hypothetical protein
VPRYALLRAALWQATAGAGDAASTASKRRPPAEADGREGGAKMPLVFPIRYLQPATERLRREREGLEEQNRKLEDLLYAQQAYLAEVRVVVAELAAREQRWRARYAEITGRAWAEDQAEASG